MRLMATQSGYWNKQLILLKPAAENITTSLITKTTTIGIEAILSDKIVHTLKLRYTGDHSTNLIKSLKTSTKKYYLKTTVLGLL